MIKITRTFPFFILILMAASKASDDSFILSVSPHDVRLKEMIRLLTPIKYNDIAGDSLARPETAKIISSLWETEKCTRFQLPAYNKLLAATVKKCEEGGIYSRQRSKECCEYLQEQFNVNKRNALASCYTALLVFSHPSIALPAELPKKIVTMMEIDAKAFKADILLMLRIASSGKPETLSPDLYAVYKQLCEPPLAPMLPLKMESYYRSFKPEPIFSRTFELDETISKKDDDWLHSTKPAKTRPIKSRRH